MPIEQQLLLTQLNLILLASIYLSHLREEHNSTTIEYLVPVIILIVNGSIMISQYYSEITGIFNVFLK